MATTNTKKKAKRSDPDEERFIATGKSIDVTKYAPGLAKVKAEMKNKPKAKTRKGGK